MYRSPQEVLVALKTLIDEHFVMRVLDNNETYRPEHFHSDGLELLDPTDDDVPTGSKRAHPESTREAKRIRTGEDTSPVPVKTNVYWMVNSRQFARRWRNEVRL